jgi:hypothetical protein
MVIRSPAGSRIVRALLALTAAAALIALGAVMARTPASSGAAAPATQQTLRIGDEIRVDGAPIGCRVTRRQGRLALDCRRAGALKGTYGALLTQRTAEIVRFSSSRDAHVVFHARHRGSARTCSAGGRDQRAPR